MVPDPWRLVGAGGLLALACAAVAPTARADVTSFFGLPYANTSPEDPTYSETLLDIFYPDASATRDRSR